MGAMPTKMRSIVSGLKRILIGIGQAIAAVAALGIVAFAALWALDKFGRVNTFYRCPGQITSSEGVENGTAFLRIEQYRGFIFWASGPRRLWVETNPQDDFLLMQKVLMDTDVMVAFAGDDGSSADLSKNSLVVHLSMPRSRYFSGECAKVDR